MDSRAIPPAVAKSWTIRHAGRQPPAELPRRRGPLWAGDSTLLGWPVPRDTRALARRFTGKDRHGRRSSLWCRQRLPSAAAQQDSHVPMSMEIHAQQPSHIQLLSKLPFVPAPTSLTLQSQHFLHSPPRRQPKQSQQLLTSNLRLLHAQ